MTDNENKRHYWAVKRHHEILFTGTFTECWEHFVETMGEETLTALDAAGYRVARGA